METIAVFCGSNSGHEPAYRDVAYHLGRRLAEKRRVVVYGGGNVGLMGAVADGALDNGGRVIGVIPEFMKEKELVHNRLSEVIVVDTMHERKAKMHELCNGVIALPGGFGTMEELFEMLTWAQLSLHEKPVAILNIDNYYEPLLLLIEKMIGKGFLKSDYRKMLLVSDRIDDLVSIMDAYQPIDNDKWFETR